MKNKKIIIAGGTGFIGQDITARFGKENDIIILTRNLNGVKTNSFGHNIINKKDFPRVKYLVWDAKTTSGWQQEVDGTDIVINLTGKTVNCRYSEKNKKEIISSRVESTEAIAKAIRESIVPPKLWINASSATIYRHAEDSPQDEISGEIKNDFSVQVCKLWEKKFNEERCPFTRKVALRMAITLGNGGVMIPYFNLLKFGLGGKQGSGKQMYSWIHIEDTCRMIEWIFENEEIEGTYNCCSPYPVTNQEFMYLLRKTTGKKFGLPAPVWLLKAGALLIGTETELLLKSRWVVPTKILATGFQFKYSKLADAFTDIVNETPRKVYNLF